jgi:hypothetical protein
MSYKYDVFISYPHQNEHQMWVKDIFLNIFELYLTNDYGKPVKIFIDRKGIESGEAWPERLKQALAHSKVLVAIWSMAHV